MPSLHYDDRDIPLMHEVILGRHSQCGVQVRDQAASRQHVRLLPKGGAWYIEDLNSANGTQVNGDALTGRRQLRDGDAIRIGAARLEFRDDDADAPTADPTALVGSVIAGYRIDALLGKGPTGDVFRAEQVSLGRIVAFKVVAPELAGDDAAIARFRAAAGNAAAMRHEGLVQLHEAGYDEHRLWYSMELVEGDNLDGILAREGTLDPAMALLVAERAALALASAHARGVFHGDLRPAALLIDPQGKVKVYDTGMAEVFGRAHPTIDHETAPSALWYLAPEQLRGRPADARADVYSLGCVLFHLLAGRAPFSGVDAPEVAEAHFQGEIPSAAEAVPGLPPRVDQLLTAMLAKNPEWRHASMSELAAELRAVRAELGEAPRTDRAERSERARQAAQRAQERAQAQADRAASRRVQRLAQAFLLLVALIVVGAFAYTYFSDAPPAANPVSGGATTMPPNGGNPPPNGQPPPNGGQQTQQQADPQTARWRATEAAIDARCAAGEWAAAERDLERAAREYGAAAAAAVALRRQRFDLDADRWWRQQAGALPAGAGADRAAARLTALDRLRDQVASAQRADAEARWQEALATLVHELNAARRQARAALDAGRPQEAPAPLAALAAVFARTPVAGLQRQAATVAAEAARLAPLGLVQGWRTQAEAKPDGEPALAVAAALLLSGRGDDARRILAAAPALAQGQLLRRREALLGREAAVLSFDDAADLQFIDVLGGDPQQRGGALGASGAAELACTVPAGGAHFTLAAAIEVDGTAQAVLTLSDATGEHLQLRLAGSEVGVRVRAADRIHDQPAPRPGGIVRLRAVCRDGALQVFVGNRLEVQVAATRIPVGSQVRFAATGAWKLHELTVLAGHE